jgi:epoxyqueuosine reductase QueG
VDPQALREKIIAFSRDAGADLVGIAPADRWDKDGRVPPDFRPAALWPPARSVVVLGLGMPLPMVETTPSIVHMELYRTVNRKLDLLAYDLTMLLNRLGVASYFFPRDGFSSLKPFHERPVAAFSHVMAAYYAGLGTVGASHCLLTPAFGPRVRFVSVFTAADLPADTPLEKDLCIRCGACADCCPKKAITLRKDRVVGDYNMPACLEMAEELTRRRCYPCGICTKVCPIGEDRKLYREKGVMKKYRQEAEALAADPDDPRYRSWTHVRRYGTP